MRTRSALALQESDDDDVGTDSLSNQLRAGVSHWRKILATFLEEASSALSSPYFYLLQSNGWKSLCLLTGLSEEVYGALLLECDLVLVTENRSDGTKNVSVRADIWNNFLMLANIMTRKVMMMTMKSMRMTMKLTRAGWDNLLFTSRRWYHLPQP